MLAAKKKGNKKSTTTKKNPPQKIKESPEAPTEFNENELPVLTDADINNLTKAKLAEKLRVAEHKLKVKDAENLMLRDQIEDVNKDLKKGNFQEASFKSKEVVQVDPYKGMEQIKVKVKAGKVLWKGVIHTPDTHATFLMPHAKLPNNQLLILEPEKAKKYGISISIDDLTEIAKHEYGL